MPQIKSFRNAVSRSTESLKNWNAITPFTKDLLVNPNDALYFTQLSIDKMAAWNLATAETKSLDAVDNTGVAVGSAIVSVNSPKQEAPIKLVCS